MDCNRVFEVRPGTTYEFDLDQNGYPAFTQKNIDFVTAIIGYDSNYSAASDTTNYESLFREPDFWSLNKLDDVVKSIDRINSTHLASEGQGGGSQGREKTTQYIIQKIGAVKLKQRLLDGDPTLVTEIASAVDTRYNFSFATKFCAYACRFALNQDNYCIYDTVVQNILPYYHYIYVDGNGYQALYRSKRTNNNESVVDDLLRGRDIEDGYAQYRKYVDEIIEGIWSKCGIRVTYAQFDHVLWYCFKGLRQRVQAALNCLPKK